MVRKQTLLNSLTCVFSSCFTMNFDLEFFEKHAKTEGIVLANGYFVKLNTPKKQSARSKQRMCMTIKSKKLFLGAHISIEGGFYKALERGASIGCTALQ